MVHLSVARAPNFGDKLISWKLAHRGSDGCKLMHDGTLRGNSHIYHMLPWPYAKMIFADRRLRLSPIHSWTDPYEKWWCDILFNRVGPLSGLQAYGLCWTTGKYDEPRWRMAGFRKDQPIVRIRCQVGSILQAGRNLIDARAGALFLGSVRYRPEKWLRQLADSVASGRHKEVTRIAAAMLVHKRNAFRFEHEARLLWLDHEPAKNGTYLDIDPAIAIDQVMTSPYATLAEHSCIENELKSCGIKPIRSGILSAPPTPTSLRLSR